MSDETPEQPPLLRIVKGDPTPEEMAALVAVVSALSVGALSVGAVDATPKTRSEWSAHHRKLSAPVRHGPGAWRAGAR